jgi:hypothetical protein
MVRGRELQPLTSHHIAETRTTSTLKRTIKPPSRGQASALTFFLDKLGTCFACVAEELIETSLAVLHVRLPGFRIPFHHTQHALPHHLVHYYCNPTILYPPKAHPSKPPPSSTSSRTQAQSNTRFTTHTPIHPMSPRRQGPVRNACMHVCRHAGAGG